MSKKIEILENTLLKLLVRRGTDVDRQLITLDQGELGFTTDSKRLFVGDGSTLGGTATGNKFLGSSANHETITDGVDGDLAFNTVTNTLFAKNGSGWDRIAVLFEAADGSIVIDEAVGTIEVGTLSAKHLENSTDITGNSIELVSGKISLSGTQIKTNRITPNSTSHLYLPQNLNINAVDYQFPVGGLGGANSYLQADPNGNLKWAAPQSNATVFFNSSAAVVPIGTIVAAASGAHMPTGWLLCNGQSVAGADYPLLSAVIGNTYGGGSVNFTLPDYTDSVHVGTTDISSFTDGTLTNTGGDYTTKGVVYFIKALADGVANPSFKVENGLVATVDGSVVAEGDSFSPLADDVVISNPVPGVEFNHHTSGTGTFTTQAPYTKFWVTGSGMRGGGGMGGSAGTVYGILSAPVGTTISYCVGAGITTTNTSGNDSCISYLSSGLVVNLALSEGARYRPTNTSGIYSALSGEGGCLNTTDDHILGGYVLSGALGGIDVSNSCEESVGAPSFWGGHGAPGAGSAGNNGAASYTANGAVKFEWGM